MELIGEVVECKQVGTNGDKRRVVSVLRVPSAYGNTDDIYIHGQYELGAKFRLTLEPLPMASVMTEPEAHDAA